MTRPCLTLAAIAALCATIVTAALAEEKPAARPPAVPLVVHDPYFSIWSSSDKLADELAAALDRRDPRPVRAWCGSTARPYRMMGMEPRDVPAMEQVGTAGAADADDLRVRGGRRARATDASPRRCCRDDLDLVARPVTYLTWRCRVDRRPAARGVDLLRQLGRTGGQRARAEGRLVAAGSGRADGDANRLAGAARAARRRATICASTGATSTWPCRRARSVSTVDRGPRDGPAGVCQGRPAARSRRHAHAARRQRRLARRGVRVRPGQGRRDSRSRGYLMLAYDDVYSIEYLGTKLRPYWRRNGMEAAELLQTAAKQYDDLMQALRGVRPAT